VRQRIEAAAARPLHPALHRRDSTEPRAHPAIEDARSRGKSRLAAGAFFWSVKEMEAGTGKQKDRDLP